jgi:hypothetical protein
MKAAIDLNGNLRLERRGKFANQYCPYAPLNVRNKPQRCGDWCPHFYEDMENWNSQGGHYIQLTCGRESRIRIVQENDRRNSE